MKRKISVIYICSIILILCILSFLQFSNAFQPASQIRNIIYMIPDGGAMAPFYLADAVKQNGGFDKTVYPNTTPVETGEMYLKKYLVGAETTYSADSEVTDSAASGTALSSGYKTYNGYIGVDTLAKPRANILEACQDMGKNTGIVSTYEWAHATPASFSAHMPSRNDMITLSEQIVNQDIDVVLGATSGTLSNAEWFTNSALSERGYEVIEDKTALLNVKAGDRIWGKLPPAHYDIRLTETTPNLAELTQAAITALNDGNEKGFFLMVEGSAIDGGAHANNAIDLVSEYLAFDEACKIAIEFAKGRTDTIVIVAPDHDTGGLYYNYSDIDEIVNDIQIGTHSSSVLWETGGHTARNGGVFMYLPDGVPYPKGINPDKASQVASDFYNAYGTFSTSYPSDAANVIDNTDIQKYISSLINVDLDKITKKLFVDVTDEGDYNFATGAFTFTNKDITIKKNTSTAMIKGHSVDLGGEIALLIEGRFYVPKKLLTIEKEAKIVDGELIYAD